MKRHLVPTLLAGATVVSPALTFLPITDIAAPNMTDGAAAFPLINIIQGPGLGFDATEPHDRLGGVWYSDAPGGFPSDYIEANPGDEIFILDLGEDKNLYEFSYWGYSNGNENGMREFEVRFATDAEGGAAGLGDELFGTSIPTTFSFEAELDPTPRQSFGFGQMITARYIEIKALSSFFDLVPGIAGGDRLGIGEFAFAEPSATGAPDVVPTPALTLDLESGNLFPIPLLNTGDSDLSVTAVSFTGPNADAFSAPTTLPVTIGPFLDGPLEIGFDPTGLEGDIEATMVVTTNDPDEATVEIPLSGALAGDLVVASPVTLTLAETGVQSFPLPISSTGFIDLTISAIEITGSDAGAVSIVSFPASLATGSDGEIVIEIDPSLAGPGALDATLEISSNDGLDPITFVVLDAGLPLTFHSIASVETNTVDFFVSSNLIQGIGTGFEAGWPHLGIGAGGGATWVTNAPNGGATDYYANDVPAPVVIFDLGADVPLNEINTWGYAASNTNGAKDYTLRFATSAEGVANFGSSITYAPTFEAAFSPTDRDVEVFDQTVVARYVEMTITDNWRGLQGGIPGGDRVGLGEVAFPVFEGSLNPLLGIVSAGRLSNGTFSITFFSSPGVSYELERSVDGLIWDRLPISITGSPEETSIIEDTSPLTDGSPAVLYRVVRP